MSSQVEEQPAPPLAAEASGASAKEEDALKDVRVSLDQARDFLFTSLRSLERFTAEARATLELLQQKKPGDEWLVQVQDQLHKGQIVMQQQQELWEQEAGRMDIYVDSVRQLANELALKDLSLQQVADNEQAKTAEQDGRFVHPELHRFKLEKTAKIVGKYGGSPALGAMVMPRLAKDAILKATASPAAREIHYSKSENKEAQHLAEVIRFKAEKKEAQLVGWQDELVGKKGKTYLEEQQAKGVAPKPPTNPSPIPADLASRLAARQAAVEQAEQDAAQQAQREAALKAAKPAQPTGELADKLQRRQQQAADQAAAAAAAVAEAAALAAEAEAVARGVDDGSGEASTSSGGGGVAGALNAELSQVLRQRRVAQAAAPAASSSSNAAGTTSGGGGGGAAGPSGQAAPSAAATTTTPGPGLSTPGPSTSRTSAAHADHGAAGGAAGGGVGGTRGGGGGEALTPGSAVSSSTPAPSSVNFRANLRTPPSGAVATPTAVGQGGGAASSAAATNELLLRFQKMR